METGDCDARPKARVIVEFQAASVVLWARCESHGNANPASMKPATASMTPVDDYIDQEHQGSELQDLREFCVRDENHAREADAAEHQGIEKNGSPYE